MGFNWLTDFNPRPKQLEVIDAIENKGYKRVFQRWHRQFGKDLVDFFIMLRAASKKAGYYIYVFPKQNQARKALWEKRDPIMGQPSRWIQEPILIRRRDDEMLLEIKTEGWTEDNQLTSVIQLVGADGDSIDRLAGISPAGVVISEAALNESFTEVMDVLMPTILANKAWLMVNSTPRGKNHFKKLEDQARKRPDIWFTTVAQNLWPDAPDYTGISTPEEIWDDAATRGKDAAFVEQEHGVSYNAIISGSWLGETLDRLDKSGRFCDLPIHPGRKVHTFWDLGRNDETVCLFFQQDGGFWNLIDWWRGTGEAVGTDNLAKMLLQRGYNYGTHVVPWDAEQRQFGKKIKKTEDYLKESLTEAGVSGKIRKEPRVGRVIDGINATKGQFHKLRINKENCEELYELLRQYKKKEIRPGEFSEQVDKKGSPGIHCADALRTWGTARPIDDRPDWMRGEQAQAATCNGSFDPFAL